MIAPEMAPCTPKHPVQLNEGSGPHWPHPNLHPAQTNHFSERILLFGHKKSQWMPWSTKRPLEKCEKASRAMADMPLDNGSVTAFPSGNLMTTDRCPLSLGDVMHHLSAKNSAGFTATPSTMDLRFPTPGRLAQNIDLCRPFLKNEQSQNKENSETHKEEFSLMCAGSAFVPRCLSSIGFQWSCGEGGTRDCLELGIVRRGESRHNFFCGGQKRK